MANYKISDLLKQLQEILSDGYEYVDIYESEADDDFPASLSFEAVENYFCGVGYDSVSSVSIPEDYDSESSPSSFSTNDPCLDIIFSYKELYTIKYSLDNVLEYFKECQKDPAFPKEHLSDIKNSSVEIRNLQAKLTKLFSRYKIS